MADLPEPQDEPDRRVLRDVAEHGHHVIKVLERAHVPGWAFSIGLFHSYAHPELVLFGLPPESMHTIINNLASDIAGGAAFPAGSTSDAVLEGYTCAFQEVDRVWYAPILGYATWFYQGFNFPVVQCLWPDRDGHLPDHPEYEPELRGVQPLLSHSTPREARLEELLHSLDS